MRERLAILTVMEKTDDTLRSATIDWIKQTIDMAFAHPTALSEAAGVSQSSLSRLFTSEDYMLSAASLAKIARVSPVTLPPPVKKRLDRAPQLMQEHNVNTHARGGIPVWGCHPVTRDGEFRLNPVSIQTIARPSGLSGSQKVVAFYTPDDTMAPRWAAGELVLVDLARPGTAGDYVLITLLATPDRPNETETGFLRRLEGRSGGQVRLSALAPDAPPVCIPIERVAEVRRVLTWNDIMR